VEEREGLNRAEELAGRARDLAERAERVAQHAAEAAGSDELLAQLERELADLDEEERKLDEEFTNLRAEESARSTGEESDRPPIGDWVTGWADRFAERMEALGTRIGDAMAGAFASRPFGMSDTVERDVTVDGPVSVQIDSFAGKITVRPGDADRVHVVAERHGWTEADRDDITVDVDRDDRGVHVRCDTSRAHGHRWVSLEVTVPPTSPTRVTTQGGSIRVERVAGPVTANTRGGSIRVDGAVGASTLETLGGAISVGGHDGPVSAHTKGGSVKLSGKLTDHVEAETMGGSVHVDGVDGAVRAQTMGGSVHVSGRLRGDCTVSTVGGSASVGVARGSNLRVEGSGSSAATDVPGLQASRGRIEGTMGDGSDGTLHLRTSGGAVRVHTI
jgi:hypothetical protein